MWNALCRYIRFSPEKLYSEWQHKKKGTSWKEHIRKAIDSLIPSVSSFDDLLAELERHGFSVKRDKNILIKAPGQQRSVSLWKLGEDYTEVSLNARIGIIQVFTKPIENQLDVYKLSEMLAVINKDHISSSRLSRRTIVMKVTSTVRRSSASRQATVREVSISPK